MEDASIGYRSTSEGCGRLRWKMRRLDIDLPRRSVEDASIGYRSSSEGCGRCIRWILISLSTATIGDGVAMLFCGAVPRRAWDEAELQRHDSPTRACTDESSDEGFLLR